MGELSLIDRWVKAWKSAGPELQAVRRREAATVPIHLAIHQLFDGMDSVLLARSSDSSGLVEQQMWFSRIRNGIASQTSAPPSSE
jgi:hypothetical protein